MSGPVSIGYLLPDPSRVRADRPVVRSGSRAVSSWSVPDWHYLTDITVTWSLDADLEGLTKDCGLTAQARIGALLAWRSERTNLRGSGSVVSVADGHNELEALLPGRELGGTVTVEARVVLLETDGLAEQLAPRRPGNLLWSAEHRITVEGSGGRFPTTASDFASAGLPGGTDAMWYLEIAESDLMASATQALRLHLNSANASIRIMLDDPVADASRGVLRFARYDTVRQLLQLALRDPEFDDRADYGRGTLGDVLVTLIRVYFPGRNIDQLRSDYGIHPAEVDAELLASTWKDPL